MLRVMLVLGLCLLPATADAFNKKRVKLLIYKDNAPVDVWDGVRHYSYSVTDENGVDRKVEEHRLWLKGSGYGLLKLAADKQATERCRNPEFDRASALCMPVELTPEKKRELYDRSTLPYWSDQRTGKAYYWIVEPALRRALRPGITDVQVKTLVDKLPKECVVALHPWAIEVKYPKCGPTEKATWVWREGWDATNVPKTVDNTHLPPEARPR